MEFFKFRAKKVWLIENEIFVKLDSEEIASLPISMFPLLVNATQKQRNNFEIVNGYALYWPDLDEDLSVAGFFESVLV